MCVAWISSMCLCLWNTWWPRWRTAYNAAIAHGKNMESNPSEWHQIQMPRSLRNFDFDSMWHWNRSNRTEKQNELNMSPLIHTHTLTQKHFGKINGIKRNQIWFSFTFISFHISYEFFPISIITTVVIVGHRECAIVVGGKYSHQFSMLTKKQIIFFSLELNVFKLEIFKWEKHDSTWTAFIGNIASNMLKVLTISMHSTWKSVIRTKEKSSSVHSKYQLKLLKTVLKFYETIYVG